jgi:hypothetical protein
VGATNAALASKVSIADYNAGQNAQNVQIASKVAQVVYDEEMSAVDALAQHFEKRFIALEEFARALLATYTITKPDSTLYNYTGSPQNMVIPPPVFSVVGKKSVSGSSVLVLEFTEYGYNTFLGDVAVWTNQGPLTFVKEDVDAQSRRLDVALPQGYTLPLNIEFRDRAESPIYTFQVTQVVFDGLTDLSAGGSSSTPITILGVSYDGLYPHILIAPHGDLDVMGFLFRNGEFVSFGGNVFGAATTTVTKIPIPGSTNLNNLSGTWSYGSTVNWADPANGGIKDDIAGVYTAPDTPRPTTGSDWTDLTNNTDIAVNNSVYSFTTGSSGSVKVFVRTDTQPGGEMFVGLWREGTVANLLNVSSTVTDRNYADMYFNGTSNVISVMQNAFNTTSTPNFVLNLLPNTKYYINTFTYWNQPKELNQADDISVRMIDALSEANLAVTYEQGVTDYDTYALVPKNFNLTISGDTVFVESREVFNGIISLYYVPAGVNDWDYAYLTNKVFANESGVKSIYVGASGLGAGAKLFIMNSNNAKISNTLIVPPPAPTYPLTIYHDADTNQIRAQATPSGVVRFNSKHPGIGGTVFDFGYSTSTTTDVNIAGYIIGSQNPAWENLYLVDLDGNQISNQLIYGVSV